MERGEVYLVNVDFLESVWLRGEGSRAKYLVCLQGDGAFSHPESVAVVIASSDRRGGTPLRAFEVSVGPDHGFDHDTIIDCRLVYSLSRERFPAEPALVLSSDVMEEIDTALIVGLQMY